jgi:hypothetical protein
MNKRIATWTGILGVTLFVVTSILAGLQSPSYSHVSQLISESYAIDTPYGELLRFYGNLPSGICLAIFAFVSVRVFQKSNRSFIMNINAIKDVVVFSSSRLKITPTLEFDKEIIVSQEKVAPFKEWFNGL